MIVAAAARSNVIPATWAANEIMCRSSEGRLVVFVPTAVRAGLEDKVLLAIVALVEVVLANFV